MSQLTDPEYRIQLRHAVFASTVGTAIEWYDFLLYSSVTGLVFAKLFFPQSVPLVGTLQAFAIYFVGFLARPIGAAIFGHYGDRVSRKSTLIVTLNRHGRRDLSSPAGAAAERPAQKVHQCGMYRSIQADMRSARSFTKLGRVNT
jgi:hypothetical protein